MAMKIPMTMIINRGQGADAVLTAVVSRPTPPIISWLKFGAGPVRRHQLEFDREAHQPLPLQGDHFAQLVGLADQRRPAN